jgi:3-oxoacyl-[acyl-carrier protein] reductase
MKSIVLASSRGIGKAIADEFKLLNHEVVSTSSDILDTSNMESVESFVRQNNETDILVLNTGGPPAKDFYDIKKEEWMKYYYQLFYSFVYMLQNIKIRNGGYIFLISSFNIKEPDPKLVMSNCYRLAFTTILKSLTKDFAKKNISNINIAPGPIDTDRLRSLVDNVEELGEKLPLGRVGKPEEIGKFVRSIVEYDIKYLTGVTINFDGGHSSYVL